jgi:7-cyano-7-deazaguanine synthase
MADAYAHPRAVVLVSGGLDSATTLAVARRDGFECYAISFDYGQRHRFELEAARKVCESLGAAEHAVIQLDLRRFGGSALTAELEVPKDRDEATMSAGIPITYVPARNTVFLSIALGWAEVLGAFDIYLGVNAVDYSGYPDCRPEFIEQFEKLANLATKAGVEGAATSGQLGATAPPPLPDRSGSSERPPREAGRFRVHAPLIDLTKAEIIRLGTELGVDYSLTHSCYDPLEDGTPCGRCDSCRLRLAGFAAAGLEDPASR